MRPSGSRGRTRRNASAADSAVRPTAAAAGPAHHRIEHFETHPDAPIIASRPGLGALTDAGVLAEIGEGCPRALSR